MLQLATSLYSARKNTLSWVASSTRAACAQAVLVALPAYVVAERLLDVEGQQGRPVRHDLDQAPEQRVRLLGRQQVEQLRTKG